MYRKFLYLIPIYGILLLLNPLYTQATTDNNNDLDAEECKEQGFDDGKNAPFNHETFDQCEEFEEDDNNNPYQEGFREGCMDVGNSEETCTDAEDYQELKGITELNLREIINEELDLNDLNVQSWVGRDLD